MSAKKSAFTLSCDPQIWEFGKICWLTSTLNFSPPAWQASNWQHKVEWGQGGCTSYSCPTPLCLLFCHCFEHCCKRREMHTINRPVCIWAGWLDAVSLTCCLKRRYQRWFCMALSWLLLWTTQVFSIHSGRGKSTLNDLLETQVPIWGYSPSLFLLSSDHRRSQLHWLRSRAGNSLHSTAIRYQNAQ